MAARASSSADKDHPKGTKTNGKPQHPAATYRVFGKTFLIALPDSYTAAKPAFVIGGGVESSKSS